MEKTTAIGIDLGTTYSCVGVYRHGRVEIIPNEMDSKTTPSYVAFNETDRMVGELARNQAAMNPENTIFDAKRLIGRSFGDPFVQEDMKLWPFAVVNNQGRPMVKVTYKGAEAYFFPEEISSMVLSKMKDVAQEYLGYRVTDAVITVPAYFNNAQKQATKNAGMIADLNVLRLISEPIAAAVAYGLHKGGRYSRNVLIFDLGGGTFDVTVMTIEDGIFDVKSTAGNTHLGGEDFDNRMVYYFINQFAQKFKKDLSSSKRALRRLRNACEKAKRALSVSTRTTIEIDSLFEGIDFYTTVTRKEFEKINEDLFMRTVEPVKVALRDANMNAAKIDDVILVGGSTRIPKIQSILQEIFDGKDLNKTINPDEAVAYGAAVHAAVLSGNTPGEKLNFMLFDVTPMSLGVASATGEIVGIVIERNTKLPTKKTKRFTTNFDHQTDVTFRIYECDHLLGADEILGQFVLNGIPTAPRNVPNIYVSFEIDVNGILNVSAVEISNGVSSNLQIIHSMNRFTDDEFARILHNAEKYRTEEEEERAKLAIKDRLESFCLRMKKNIEKKMETHQTLHNSDREIAKRCNEILKYLDDNQMVTREELENMKRSIETLCNIAILQGNRLLNASSM